MANNSWRTNFGNGQIWCSFETYCPGDSRIPVHWRKDKSQRKSVPPEPVYVFKLTLYDKISGFRDSDFQSLVGLAQLL